MFSEKFSENMLSKFLSIRICLLLVSAFSVFAILAALVMQYFFDMAPCPLCISQRIFIILAGISALIAAIGANHLPTLRIGTVFSIIFAIVGACISARHVWIQNLPEDQVPLCGPGLGYMFETRPLFDALGLLFSGDGNCADVLFTFLGLSIPGWTFVAFAGMIAWLSWLLIRSFNKTV